MKKILLSIVIYGSVFMVNSCSKSDLKQSNGCSVSPDLSKTLYNSSEFSSYVTATNNILSSMNLQTVSSSDNKSAPNKEYFTKAEMQAFLKSVHVNENVYFQNRQVMAQAIESFQRNHHLTNEQSASLWNNVINTHSESFRNNSLSLPNIPAIIDCAISAGTTFAATTAVCLALREIPIIGEELFRICEEEAINTLIDSLLGCIQL